MKNVFLKITENRALTASAWQMTLAGDCTGITKPGQFINIKLDGLYLRRPISVCDVEGDRLTIIYKAVGVGTEKMANAEPGEKWLTLTGLGNGYDLTKSGHAPLLIGGGAGVPPMYYLAKLLVAEGKKATVILGFGKQDEVFFKEKFEALGLTVYVTTVDGSEGIRGFVTDAMDGINYTYFYTCGPEPMLKAVYNTTTTSGQFSFEERMGCGFGACMGCTCKTKYGNKRICRDGPVLEKEEIIW